MERETIRWRKNLFGNPQVKVSYHARRNGQGWELCRREGYFGVWEPIPIDESAYTIITKEEKRRNAMREIFHGPDTYRKLSRLKVAWILVSQLKIQDLENFYMGSNEERSNNHLK